MTAQKPSMHCKNPLCFDDECRGECESTHEESKGGRLHHGDDEQGFIDELYCED